MTDSSPFLQDDHNESIECLLKDISLWQKSEFTANQRLDKAKA